MTSAKLRVAVIGAGSCGLTAIKCCLDEGLDPVCYELSSDLGGLWNYRDEVDENIACVMRTTVINTSKEMMSYSDYPIPAHYPNFMHNSLVLAYFRSYAKHFGLDERILYRRKVHGIEKCERKWMLTIENLETSETLKVEFDAVLIASGHHTTPIKPKFEGLETFEGEVLHTHDYRGSAMRFNDKTVVVVGNGNSGLDVAVEISRITKQTYVSTRRGTWVFNRVGYNGLPLDVLITRRWVQAMLRVLPMNYIMEKVLNSRFDHALYGLKPDHSPFDAHPTINDELPNRICSGSVIVKPNITRVGARAVTFTDGSRLDGVDVIVLGTGYRIGFPFMKNQLFEVVDNKVCLFKYMFPPEEGEHTLAVLGCIQPWGAIMPISEMQCRLACRVFKGEIRLPGCDAMWQDIRHKQKVMEQRYAPSLRHTIQVDYIPFMDELAEMVGCKPKLTQLLMTDPRLFWSLFFGPMTSYQYRLHGPGSWPGAREAIMTQWQRIEAPFKTRQVSQGVACKNHSTGRRCTDFQTSFVLKVLCLLVLFFALYYHAFV